MKINIILITYNHSAYIREAIESILMQKTDYKVEIIVADDASTDDTLSIIESYANNTPFTFKFLPKENNLGFVKNYQRAFNACKGDYVAIMEGDDYWTDPYRLQKHIDFLQNHRECVMSFNRIIFYYQEKSDFRINEWTSTEDYHLITTKQLTQGNKIGNLSACVFRKSVLDKLKPDLFELRIADWMLGMVVGQYGFIAELKEPMSVYRIHGNGLWSRQNEVQQTQEMLEHIAKYNEYLEFKYNDDFTRFENYLKSTLTKKRKHGRSDYIPPIFIYISKLLLPPVIFRKIKK